MSLTVPTARCRIETKIRLLSFVCLIVGLTQTFFDVFVLLTYRHTMGDFQVSWLYFNCFALVAQLVLLLYGFHAMAKQEYHSATTFRSWLLFIGTSLFFSGFFHIIGQCKDVQLFYTSCSHGFKASEHHERLPDDEAVLSHASCRTVSEEWAGNRAGLTACMASPQAFHALLASFLVVWLTHQLALGWLFFCAQQPVAGSECTSAELVLLPPSDVNRFKNDNYYHEEEEAEESHRLEVEKRRKGIDTMPSILIHSAVSSDNEQSPAQPTSSGSW